MLAMACGKAKWKERGSKCGPQNFGLQSEDTVERKKKKQKTMTFALCAGIFSALNKGPFLFSLCFSVFFSLRLGKAGEFSL